MLKVSVHASDLRAAGTGNRVGWMDIGYDKLAPVADYKALLFTVGLGAVELAYVRDYPRYCGSIFDLVARAIAVCLQREESLPPAPAVAKCAYGRSLSVIVTHVGPRGPFVQKRLAWLEATMRRRGVYDVVADEDVFGERTARVHYRPARFVAWHLAAYAMTQCLAGTDQLPPRPPLLLPKVTPSDEGGQVLIQSLHEPARSCLVRWLGQQGKPVDPDLLNPSFVPEATYVRFLTKTV